VLDLMCFCQITLDSCFHLYVAYNFIHVRNFDSICICALCKFNGYIAVVVADECELIASSSRDKSIRLWNWSEGQTVITLKLPGSAGGYARRGADEYSKQRVWTALCWPRNDQLVSAGLK